MKAVVMSAVAALALGMSGMASADGLALAQKNACMSCHGIDKKIVGPAYKDVAAKYKGVWGQIPMPPNPQVKDDDVKKIVEWVLSL